MAKKITDCALVIPVYNEASVIVDVILSLKNLGWEKIIVVDDGSCDDTELVLSKINIYYVKHFINRGKGAAVATGFEMAKYLNIQNVITMDGDGQHSPKDALGLYQKLKEGNDLVLGVRTLEDKNMPIPRKLARFLANVLTFLLFGVWVSDSQSGMRAYGKKATKHFEVVSDDYEFDTIILSQIRRLNLKFCEYPIHTIYTNYSQNKNKTQGWKNSFITIKNIILSQIYA